MTEDELMAAIADLTERIKAHREGARAAAEERRRLIVEACSRGLSDGDIARAAGVTRQAVFQARTGQQIARKRRRKRTE